jgi:hypothetical protein
MTVELNYLVAATLLTLLIRVGWMLNKVQVRGLAVVVGYPKESEPLSEWAHRLWVAHEDAIQSLVTFAVLVNGNCRSRLFLGKASSCFCLYFRIAMG